MAANKGLVLAYTFDNPNSVGFDSSLKGHTLTLQGPAGPATPGKPGTSLSVDGTSNSVCSTPSRADLSFSNGFGTDLPFTIAFWYNPTVATSSTVKGILTKGGTDGTREWNIEHGLNVRVRLMHPAGGGSSITAITTGSPVVQGTWTHYIITYDGSETAAGIIMYVNNGLNSATKSMTGTYTGMTPSGGPLYINALGQGAANSYLNGFIDSVYIYNRVITEAERIELFNGSAGFNPVVANNFLSPGYGYNY